MALSLRNLLDKLGGGIKALKPLPKPIDVTSLPQVQRSARAQATLPQTRELIRNANQASVNAQPLNVIRNAPAQLPRLNFANKYKNPVTRFVATIPQEIANAPRDVFAGSLGLGANIADVAYGKKPSNVLRNIGTIGSGFVNAYVPKPIGSLAVQAGKQSLRELAKRGAIQGAKLGGLGGAFYGLQEGDTAKKQLGNALKGGLTGAVVGGVAGAAIPAVSEAYKKGKISLGLSVKNVGDTPLHQEARKYKTPEEFVKAQTVKDNVLEGAMGHRPTRTGATADNVSQEVSGMGMPDFYENPRIYNYGGKAYDESIDILKKIKGKPDAEITIYRASPKNELRTGDWVTLSKEKAKLEALTEGTPVQSFKVKASEVEFAGDDVTEFGYWGHSTQTKSQLTDIWNKANKQGGFIDFGEIGQGVKRTLGISDRPPRKALDPDEAITGQVIEELLTSSPGERIGIGQARSMEQKFTGVKSSFPKWVPENLRSTKLFNQVIDDVTASKAPKGGKRGELYEVIQNEINRRLELPEDYLISTEAKIRAQQQLGRLSGSSNQVTSKVNQLPSSQVPGKTPRTPGTVTSSPQVLSKNLSSTQPVTEPGGAVNKIIKAIKEAKPIRGEQERLYRIERSKRVGMLAGVQKNLKPGEAGYYQQLGQLKGELPKADFETIRNKITQDDIAELFNQVRQAPLAPLEKVTAETALTKMLGKEGAKVPTKGELALLREVFPEELVKALEENRGLIPKIYEGVVDIANIPRSVMTVADISAPGRQGIFNIGRKEWWQNLPNAFKYAFSENSYQEAMAQIRSRGTYTKMREAKLALTDLSGNMTQREERFMSTLAERIPGFGRIVRGSGRSYTGFLTKLRADMFDNIYRSGQQAGVGDEMLESLGKFINAATGRGSLPSSLEKISSELNAVFFSPRLLASRLNLVNPRFYYKLDPFVRKEALKTLAGFMGISTGVLTLATLGGATVVTDPRNSDFAKIKIGNTRYDILGGFQQPIRTAAQLITGKHISSTTGRVTTLGEGYRPLTRTEILLRFFESKESPVVSLISSLWDGTNFLGQPVNLPTEIANRLIPMVLQDAYDLYKESGDMGLLMAVPAIFGVGVQTYGTNEPGLHITPSGKASVKGMPVPGIGEDISSTFFPKKPQAKETIQTIVQDLKSGKIDAVSAKGLIRQAVLQDVALKINSSPEAKKALAPMYVKELSKKLKSDVKSVANDYTLTKEQKAKQIKLLIENFKKSVKELNLTEPNQVKGFTQTKNILPFLGPITGLNGSSYWRPGLDIDLKIGDPVPSPIAGKVISSGFNGGFGNQVKIAGIDGREYWLSHLSKGVAPGSQVQAGQIVGLGGNTGNVIPGRGGDGSHLDLTVKQGGSYLSAPQVAQLLKTFG